ncbi:hypothetical protein [Niabella sp.]|uniref:hypothetical protein n=1 Tax=Niabella sp. TaxID=1962976 RepID=UPI002613DE4A|nr:hypothetical protein [Niabella sp.]
MNTFLPAHIGFALLLMLFQTYLLFYVTLFLLRRLKLLKRPYNGMDDAELVMAATILLGVMFLSGANTPGLIQAARSYSDIYPSIGRPLLLYFARFFIIVLFFSGLYITLCFVNLRILFRRHYPDPGMAVSILVAAVTIGMALICWFTSRAIIDQMTPQFINFR